MTWVNVEMSWVELGGGGWSLVELGARFSNTQSIIYFIKQNSQKGNYYSLVVFSRISISQNYGQKK